MTKVAILTHSVASNYGANLQALSTGAYLKAHGLEPIFICWSDYLSTKPSEQSNVHRTFLLRNGYKVTVPCSTYLDFENIIENEGIRNIIVGSDCVLTYKKRLLNYTISRKGIVKLPPLSSDYDFPNPFWLPFLKGRNDIRRFLMSASCGSTNFLGIGKTIKKEMQELLLQYNYLSVRDINTMRVVRRLLGQSAHVELTPDPVFGFNDNVKEQIKENFIKDHFHLPDKYVVVSFYGIYWPNQSWATDFCNAAHSKGLTVVSLLMPNDIRSSSFDIDVDLPLDPMDWYAIIKHSCGYIGNNMHPLIASIHNCVPFFSYNIHGNYYLNGHVQSIRNSKETSLLSMGNLLEYQIAQKRFNHITPTEVIEKIVSFDFEKCQKLSENLNQSYHKMMSSILALIKE